MSPTNLFNRAFSAVTLGSSKRLLRGSVRAASENPGTVGMLGVMGATGVNPFTVTRDPSALAQQAGINQNLAATMHGTLLRPKLASLRIEGARHWYGPDTLAKVASAAGAARAAAQGGEAIARTAPDLKHLLLLGAGLAAAAEGVGAVRNVIAAGANKLKDRSHEKSRGSRWAAVVKIDSSLASNPEARRAFDIIDRASPYAGSEPAVAASMVRRLISTSRLTEHGGMEVDPKEIQGILNVEKTRTETRRNNNAPVDTKGLSSGIDRYLGG